MARMHRLFGHSSKTLQSLVAEARHRKEHDHAGLERLRRQLLTRGLAPEELRTPDIRNSLLELLVLILRDVDHTKSHKPTKEELIALFVKRKCPAKNYACNLEAVAMEGSGSGSSASAGTCKRCTCSKCAACSGFCKECLCTVCSEPLGTCADEGAMRCGWRSDLSGYWQERLLLAMKTGSLSQLHAQVALACWVLRGTARQPFPQAQLHLEVLLQRLDEGGNSGCRGSTAATTTSLADAKLALSWIVEDATSVAVPLEKLELCRLAQLLLQREREQARLREATEMAVCEESREREWEQEGSDPQLLFVERHSTREVVQADEAAERQMPLPADLKAAPTNLADSAGIVVGQPQDFKRPLHASLSTEHTVVPGLTSKNEVAFQGQEQFAMESSDQAGRLMSVQASTTQDAEHSAAVDAPVVPDAVAREELEGAEHSQGRAVVAARAAVERMAQRAKEESQAAERAAEDARIVELTARRAAEAAKEKKARAAAARAAAEAALVEAKAVEAAEQERLEGARRDIYARALDRVLEGQLLSRPLKCSVSSTLPNGGAPDDVHNAPFKLQPLSAMASVDESAQAVDPHPQRDVMGAAESQASATMAAGLAVPLFAACAAPCSVWLGPPGVHSIGASGTAVMEKEEAAALDVSQAPVLSEAKKQCAGGDGEFVAITTSLSSCDAGKKRRRRRRDRSDQGSEEVVTESVSEQAAAAMSKKDPLKAESGSTAMSRADILAVQEAVMRRYFPVHMTCAVAFRVMAVAVVACRFGADWRIALCRRKGKGFRLQLPTTGLEVALRPGGAWRPADADLLPLARQLAVGTLGLAVAETSAAVALPPGFAEPMRLGEDQRDGSLLGALVYPLLVSEAGGDAHLRTSYEHGGNFITWCRADALMLVVRDVPQKFSAAFPRVLKCLDLLMRGPPLSGWPVQELLGADVVAPDILG
eukprot:SM000032S12081  [mRNA]  locus=s32:411875:415535:+ [translate_table: standard]